MTLTQFKYVLEIAKTGSVNQAAANLFVSQSVLSNAIKTLEAELHQKIFFRTTKGMELTPFGENFIAYISPIQLHMDQLNTMLNHGGEVPRTTLSIVTTGFYQVSTILGTLIRKYASSDLRIEIVETSLEEAMNMISHGLADLAFIRRWSCYYSLTNKRLRSLHLDYFPLRSFPMGIAVGKGSPLYHSAATSVTAEELREFPCIIYNYIESGPYRDIYDKLNLSIKSRIITNSRSSMYELLNETPAYFLNATLPPFTSKKGSPANAEEYAQYRALRLENCDIETEYGWIVRKGLEDECIDLVSQWLRS